MYKFLSESVPAAQFLQSLDAAQGVTSGAEMRAGPLLGLLPDIQVVKDLTEMQARITHDTKAGVNSVLAVALSVHFLHHGGKPQPPRQPGKDPRLQP